MKKSFIAWAAAAVFVASLFTPVLASPDCSGGTCKLPGKTVMAKAKQAPAHSGCPAMGKDGACSMMTVPAKGSKAKTMSCPMTSGSKGKMAACPTMTKGKAVKSKTMACGKNCNLKKGKPCTCPTVKSKAKAKAMSCGADCKMTKGKPCDACPVKTTAKAKTGTHKH